MTDINKAGVRAALPPRREPYWRHLEGTGYIGYRKMESGSETWQARWRPDRGTPLQQSLGRLSKANDFAAASKAAREWFAQCEQGVPKAGTVEEACKAYVDNISVMKPDAALEPHQRFKVWVYKKSFGRKRLGKLRPIDVQKWRDSLIADGKRNKASANRILRTFKAAMNYAKHSGMVERDNAWTNVKPYPVADGKREVYLTKKQVKEMLDAAPSDLANLLRGYLYTGCRPGELPKARVKDFDAKAGLLTLATNKGRDGISRKRKIPLAGAALAFFKDQAKGKFPNTYLMTKLDGEPWERQQWYRGIQAVRANVDSLPNELCAYNLRHTTISNWLANGVNLEVVAKVTGTSIAMIEKNYYQFIPTDVADQLSAIDII